MVARRSSAMDIEIIGNMRGVQRVLRGMDTAMNPVALAGFMGAVVDPYLMNRARDRFRNEGDDVVGRWVPHAPATAIIRAGQGFPSGPINHRTGELERFITQRGSVTATALGAVLVTPGVKPSGKLKKKVQTAQSGSPGGKGQRPTPARPVMGLNWNDMGFLVGALAFHIQGVQKRAGARVR